MKKIKKIKKSSKFVQGAANFRKIKLGGNWLQNIKEKELKKIKKRYKKE